jgi:hypothetical protein
MVPVKEAIGSGAWLHFSSTDGALQFRLKVLSFKKLDLSQVDEPHNIENKETRAQWWLMEIEAVNLSKRTIGAHDMCTRIVLMDQEEFQFNVIMDSHLACLSEFSKKSGLHRFYVDDLIPKTKAVGAISFRLPDDDEAEYSLVMEDGTVREA